MKTSARFGFLQLTTTCLVTTFLMAAPRCARAADELLGATKVLQQLADESASPHKKATNTSPQELIRAELAAFATNSAALTPADAANGWLALADRVFDFESKADPTTSRNGRGQPSQQLLGALPGPAAWTSLRGAIEARPEGKADRRAFELGLRLLIHTLDNDSAARKKDLTALEDLSKKVPRDASWGFKMLFRELNQALLATSDDPDLVLKTLELQLNASDEDRWRNSIEMPNLVALVGEAKSEAFLRKALVHPKLALEINAGNATHSLAQKLALEMAAQLKTPQWKLVNSLGTSKLYEALEKQFPAKTNSSSIQLDVPTLDVPDAQGNDNDQQNARLYYLLSLISEGRGKDAVVVAKRFSGENDVYFPPDGLKALEQAGYTTALDDFLFELLSQNPEVPFWLYYANISAKAGQTDRMLALARSTLVRKDLSTSSKAALQQNLFAALLAADKVEEGVAELRKQIAQPTTRRNPRSRNYFAESGQNLGITLAQLGQLESRKDWLEEGIAATKKTLAEPRDGSSYYFGGYSPANTLAGLLVGLGRHTEAEQILVAEIRQTIQQTAKQQNGRGSDINYFLAASGTVAPQLGTLALLYHKLGRPDDVITLLEKSPDWGTGDLAKVKSYNFLNMRLGGQSAHGREHGLSVKFIAASALAKTGRIAEARTILSSVLADSPGSDAAYVLLLELGGDKVSTQLDALFARDQFEERPLIWKAEWLRRKGELETAEKLCRQAISIDPSDGEQGPDDRMRVYAVLAEIRAARGDAKEAEFFRGVVSAIRLSERADGFASAGLIKRAVAMYEESLTKFADAYCIQSRLAVQLAEMGKHTEAEAHYRKAYELMPESFGRVESHCFGCERAFDGQKAQSLAEKIFSELAVKTPKKPQVHYLLGYLRAEQERYQEAVTHFQKAVSLDPDYLNAWIKIQGMSEHVCLPAVQRDDVCLNILRLDPASRHSETSLQGIADLRRVWLAVAEGAKLRPAQPQSLFVLAASQAELKKNKKHPQNDSSSDGGDDIDAYQNFMGGGQSGLTPSSALRNNAFVQAAEQLLSAEFAAALSTD